MQVPCVDHIAWLHAEAMILYPQGIIVNFEADEYTLQTVEDESPSTQAA